MDVRIATWGSEDRWPYYPVSGYIGRHRFALCRRIVLRIYGVSVLVNADWEHGSSAGNIFMGGFGFLLFLIALVLFAFGVIAWQTSKSS
jgi:hypothetical protein